jgi:hypothetical protein
LALKTEPEAAGSLVSLAGRIELWPIDRLRPYERNPRTHSEAQVDQIAASMVEFGWTNPVLVDEQGGILAGHGRLLAARKLGLAEVPVIRFEHLSEAQKRAYLIADNQLALQAGWDDALLAEELAWLRDERFDLAWSASILPSWSGYLRSLMARQRAMSRASPSSSASQSGSKLSISPASTCAASTWRQYSLRRACRAAVLKKDAASLATVFRHTSF